MNVFGKITWRTLKRNRARTVITIVGVILAAAMLTAVTAFAVSLQQFLVVSEEESGGNWHLLVENVSSETAGELAEASGVEAAMVLTGQGFGVPEEDPSFYVYLEAFPRENADMVPFVLEEGRMPETGDEILISSHMAELLGLSCGDSLIIGMGELRQGGRTLTRADAGLAFEGSGDLSLDARSRRTFSVAGVYSYTAVDSLLLAEEVFTGPVTADGSCRVYLRLEEPRTAFSFPEEHDEWLSEGVSWSFHQSLLRYQGVVDNDRFYLVMVQLIAFLLAIIMFGSAAMIYNAFSISLRERTASFGLLACMGATKKQLRHSMLWEAVFVGGIGIPLGVLAGIAGTGITLGVIGKGLSAWINGRERVIPLKISWELTGLAVCLSALTVLLSVWIPAGRVKKMSPMEAVRSAKDIRVRGQKARTGKGIFALFGLPGMLAAKNYRRDRRRYRSTVFSLTLSIALYVAASLFNSYLTEATGIVLTAPKTELQYRVSAPEEVCKEALDLIQGTEGVESVSGYRLCTLFLTVEEEEIPERIRGRYQGLFDRETGKRLTSVQIAILPDEVFADFGADTEGVKGLPVVYYNRTSSYNPDTKRYDELTTWQPREGEPLTVGNAAVPSDSVTNPETGEAGAVFTQELVLYPVKGADALPEAFFEEEYQSRLLLFFVSDSAWEEWGTQADILPEQVYGIRCRSHQAVYEELSGKLGDFSTEYGGYLKDLAGEYETDRNSQMALQVLTFGFLVLISLIAAANVYNTVSTNLSLRRREAAMLRSVGMSRKSLRNMLLYEGLTIALRCIVYGAVISLAESWILQWILNGGVDTRFRMPLAPLAVSGAGAAVLLFASMLLGFRKWYQTDIIEELKSE